MKRVPRWLKYTVFTAVALTVVGAVKSQSDARNKYTCDPGTVIVREGDTIAGIASARCTGNVSRAIDDAVNKRGSSDIYPGQALNMPEGS